MTRYAQGMIGAAFVSGCALVMAAIFLPGKLGLAILGYLLAFVGGHMLALFKAERFLPPALGCGRTHASRRRAALP
jgi:zinc transporter ZupT